MDAEDVSDAALTAALRDFFLHLTLSDAAALWVVLVPSIVAQERVVAWVRDAVTSDHRVETFRFGEGGSLAETVRRSPGRPQDALLALDLLRLSPRVRDETIAALNRGREAIADGRCTVVLFVDPDGLRALIRRGGDLWTWRRGVTDLCAVPGIGDDEREVDVARRREAFLAWAAEETAHAAPPSSLALPLVHGRSAPDLPLDAMDLRLRQLDALPLAGSVAAGARVSIAAVLAAHDAAALIGPWGGGKRTWLRCLARDLVLGRVSAATLGLRDGTLPLCFDARELADVGVGITRRQVRDALHEVYARKGNPDLAGAAIHAIEDGGALILVASVERVSPRKRPSLLKRLQETTQRHPGVRVIVSCTPYLIDDALEGWARVGLPRASGSAMLRAAHDIARHFEAAPPREEITRVLQREAFAHDRSAIAYAALKGADPSMSDEDIVRRWEPSALVDLSRDTAEAAPAPRQVLPGLSAGFAQLAWTCAPRWPEREDADDLSPPFRCYAAAARRARRASDAERASIRRDPRWAVVRTFAPELDAPSDRPQPFDDLFDHVSRRHIPSDDARPSPPGPVELHDLLSADVTRWLAAARDHAHVDNATLDALTGVPALRALTRARLRRGGDPLDALQPFIDPSDPETTPLVLDTLAHRCSRQIHWMELAGLARSPHPAVRAALWRLAASPVAVAPLAAMYGAIDDDGPAVRAALTGALMREVRASAAWRAQLARLLDRADDAVTVAFARAVCRAAVRRPRPKAKVLRALGEVLATQLRARAWCERVGVVAATWLREALGVIADQLAMMA